MDGNTWFVFLRRGTTVRLFAGSDQLTPEVANVVREAVASYLAEEPIYGADGAVLRGEVEVQSYSQLKAEQPATLLKLAGEWERLQQLLPDFERHLRSFHWDAERDDFFRHWSEVLKIDPEQLDNKLKWLRRVTDVINAARTHFGQEPRDRPESAAVAGNDSLTPFQDDIPDLLGIEQAGQARTGRLSLDVEGGTVTLDGRCHHISSKQALRWLAVLSKHPGEWISNRKLSEYDRDLADVRTDKVKKRLPPEVIALIESRTGAGSRLVL
jgi:hypothetical protein